MPLGDLHNTFNKDGLGPLGYKGNLKCVFDVFEFNRTSGSAIASDELFESNVLKIPAGSLFLGIRIIRDFGINLRFHRKLEGKAREAKYFAQPSTNNAGQLDMDGAYGATTSAKEGNVIGTVLKETTIIVPRAAAGVSAAVARGNFTVMLFYVNI